MQYLKTLIGSSIGVSDITINKASNTNSCKCASAPGGNEYDVFIFCLSGNGKLECPQAKINCTKGDLLYVPAGIDYSFVIKGGETQKAAYYETAFRLFDYTENLPQSTYISPLPMMIKTNRQNSDKMEEHYFNEMFYYSKRNLVGKELLMTAVFYKLLYEMYDSFFNADVLPYYEEIKEGIKYIENNYLEEFKVDDVAKMCGICISRFHKFFKECTGLTPIEYKNMLKINNAIEILKKKEHSVEEVSELLNFCNQSYFIRTFKKFTGSTPRELIGDLKN